MISRVIYLAMIRKVLEYSRKGSLATHWLCAKTMSDGGRRVKDDTGQGCRSQEKVAYVSFMAKAQWR